MEVLTFVSLVLVASVMWLGGFLSQHCLLVAIAGTEHAAQHATPRPRLRLCPSGAGF